MKEGRTRGNLKPDATGARPSQPPPQVPDKVAQMREALQEALDYIRLDWDCLVESVTLDDDTIPDPEDQADVEEVEALIEKMEAALRLDS